MKKNFYLLAVVMIFFATPSIAQIKKGAIFLGGDIGGSTQKTTYSSSVNNDKQNSLYISPVFGKAIKENLVFGFKVMTNIFNEKVAGASNEIKQNSYGAGVFIRKYRSIGKSGFFIFVEGNLGYSYNKTKNIPFTTAYNTDKRNTVSINLFPGLSYTISRKLQLETGLSNLLSLSYFTEKRYEDGIIATTSKTNGFGVSSSISSTSPFYIGLRILIN